MCDLQICNCIQSHYKMYCSVLTPHCNASKARKRKKSTCNGVKMAQQECESFFRMRGWLELLRQKKFLSTSSLSKSFSFFLMQSWTSCKYVSATLECIGFANNTERCICVARKMQIFLAWHCNASKAGKWQTNKCIEERWFGKSFSLCVFLKCKIQLVVLECNIMQKSCRNT